MIGQRLLKRQFEEMSEIPRSMIFLGAEGSGRKVFTAWLADTRHMSYCILSDTGVDAIRELISVVYDTVDETLYVIPDIEQMSASAQNALLKVLEEPPQHVHFALTATQENLVLSTILSRCFVFHMDTYTDSDIVEYYRGAYETTYSTAVESVILDYCTTPGEVNDFMAMDIEEFAKYVKFVFEHIATVSGANSFKIASKINLADDRTKYNLTLFWRAFIVQCFKYYDDNSAKYIHGISVTSDCLKSLRVKGANKPMLFDMWILKIREGWLSANGSEED